MFTNRIFRTEEALLRFREYHYILKVIEMLGEAQILATKPDTDDCHRLEKNGNPIVLFVNRTFAITFWKKRYELQKNIDKSKLGFDNDTKIYISENIMLYNQRLASKCRK